jgi:hypothetical protein
MVKESKLYDSLGTFASDVPLHRLALLEAGMPGPGMFEVSGRYMNCC